MNSTPITRLAILGTISDLHSQPLPYDLACLSKIVAEQAPDLLCAEITNEAWEQSDLSAAELEVRESLAPVTALTDIVLVPVSSSDKQYAEFASHAGLRHRATQLGIRVLRWGQRQAATPEAIHGFLFEAFCHTVCTLTEATWTAKQRAEWEKQNDQMVENILQIVRRDPGRRVLVVVQCQRLHHLTLRLMAHPDEVELVHYRQL